MTRTQADILIVDDSLESIRLLSEVLTDSGYRVRKAINGQLALGVVEHLQPDLILLDICLPDIDGYEVCQQFKADARFAAIPIIFLSALGEPFDKAKAFAVGAADYMTKPLQLEEVLIRVRHQLALQESQQQVQQLTQQLEQRVQERTRQLELMNAQLQEMALHDSLTLLPNRNLLMDRIQQSLLQSKINSDYRFAVLYLDCDRFKLINDSLGHCVGDELLIAVSKRIKSLLRQNDVLSRLGGDEFVVLLTHLPDEDTAIQVAKRILDALNEPFVLKGHTLFISVSIGIALGSDQYDETEHLLRDADTVRFDASDLMPGFIGTDAFWSAMVEWVNSTPTDEALTSVEEVWSAQDDGGDMGDMDDESTEEDDS